MTANGFLPFPASLTCKTYDVVDVDVAMLIHGFIFLPQHVFPSLAAVLLDNHIDFDTDIITVSSPLCLSQPRFVLPNVQRIHFPHAMEHMTSTMSDP